MIRATVTVDNVFYAKVSSGTKDAVIDNIGNYIRQALEDGTKVSIEFEVVR